MKRLFTICLVLGLTVSAARGQVPSWQTQARDLVPLSDLVSNQVQVLEAAGDSLWIGPLLTVYVEGEDALRIADVPTVNEGDDVVSSIAARNDAPQRDRVWAGLAFDTGEGVAGAGGFLVSTDGGDSFTERPDQLDEPDDTTVAYGGSRLPAVPIIQQADSAPQDVAFGPDADTAWVAGLRSGIRWVPVDSTDWNRAVLPPDTSQSVDPTTPTDFLVSPPLDDGRGFLNHVGFSVLVDETGTVWAGTAQGVNRSEPGSVTSKGRRAWRRFGVADTASSLTGASVVALEEQPRPGRNPIWMATWAGQQEQGPLQRFGVTVTPDGGDTFRQTLIGERIFDLAARRDRVFAAGETGLFVSDDQGETWRSIENFPLQNDDRVLPPEVRTQAVSVTDAALWVGTADGLLRLDRSEESALLDGRPKWRLFRAETPVNPEAASEEVPDVPTYAYPNPFVPASDQLVRIVYELQESRTVEVTVYDYGMNRVWGTTQRKPAGQQETVWDGTDDRGLRVPTGTYFYRVEFGDETLDGKILIAN
jgi:hypothetical protein